MELRVGPSESRFYLDGVEQILVGPSESHFFMDGVEHEMTDVYPVRIGTELGDAYSHFEFFVFSKSRNDAAFAALDRNLSPGFGVEHLVSQIFIKFTSRGKWTEANTTTATTVNRLSDDARVNAGSSDGVQGGGPYHVGFGVRAPKPIYNPEPEFSDEARKNKLQGNVVLRAIVGSDGKTHDVAVLHSLGMGLDEKAMEAVRSWRFEPGTKDGSPVPVEIKVEVNFHFTSTE